MELFFHLSALIMGSSISAATAEETAPLLSQQQAGIVFIILYLLYIR